MQFGQGGVYTLFVHGNQDLGYEQTLSRFRLTSENSVHMLWQVWKKFPHSEESVIRVKMLKNANRQLIKFFPTLVITGTFPNYRCLGMLS